MVRIVSSIKATSGAPSLGSAMYYFCRHMLYGHRQLLLGCDLVMLLPLVIILV